MVRAVLICGVVFMLGCDGLEESNASGSNAEAQAVAGKGDNGDQEQASETSPEVEAVLDEEHAWVVDGEDICETFGLYDDENCDAYCPLVDPACPASAYEEEVAEEEDVDCGPEAPLCLDGENSIDTDQNGCPDTCVEAGVGCATNGDCEEGEYCHRPDGECGAVVGACTAIPDCGELDWDTFEAELVCGCDGYPYLSPCDAHLGGTSIAYAGICEFEEDED